MSCLRVLLAITVFPIVGFLAAGLGYHLTHPPAWHVTAVGQPLSVHLDAGSYALYESASYESALELRDSADTAVTQRSVIVPARTERDGRVFRLVSVVQVVQGQYDVRSSASAFTHPAALVALGPRPGSEWNGIITWGAVGGVLAFVAGLVYARRGGGRPSLR